MGAYSAHPSPRSLLLLLTVTFGSEQKGHTLHEPHTHTHRTFVATLYHRNLWVAYHHLPLQWKLWVRLERVVADAPAFRSFGQWHTSNGWTKPLLLCMFLSSWSSTSWRFSGKRTPLQIYIERFLIFFSKCKNVSWSRTSAF